MIVSCIWRNNNNYLYRERLRANIKNNNNNWQWHYCYKCTCHKWWCGWRFGDVWWKIGNHKPSEQLNSIYHLYWDHRWWRFVQEKKNTWVILCIPTTITHTATGVCGNNVPSLKSNCSVNALCEVSSNGRELVNCSCKVGYLGTGPICYSKCICL